MAASLTALPGRSVLAFLLYVAPVSFLATVWNGSLLWAPAVIGVAGLAWLSPGAVLAGLVVLTPLCRFPGGFGLTPESLALSKAALVLFLAAVLWLKDLHRATGSVFLPWMKLLFGVWLSLTFLSVLLAQDMALSLHYMIGPLSGLGFFLIFTRLPKDKHRPWLILLVSVAGAVAALAIVQYIFVTHNVGHSLWRFIIAPGDRTYYTEGPNLMNATYQYRASGTFSHSNHLGIYLALLFPFSLVLALEQHASSLRTWSLRGISILLLVGLVTTNSRTGLLVCAVGGAWVGVHRGYRWLWGAGLAGVLGLMLFSILHPTPLQDSLNKILRVETRLSGREQVWRNGLNLISRSPWLGVGPGNLSSSYVTEFGYFVYNTLEEQNILMETLQKKGEGTTHRFHLHNLYLQLAAELGVLGPILFLVAALASLFYLERGILLNNAFHKERALHIATAASMIGFLVFGLFESQVPFSMLGLNLAVAPLWAIGIKS